MFSNQLGRRNLTEEQRTFLIGKRNEAEKNSIGFNQYSREGFQSGNPQNRGGTAERLAKEYGIGQGSVVRAEKYAKGIDAIRDISPETADSILSGETKVTKQDVSMVAKAEPEERKRMVQQIEKGEKITPVAVPDKIVNKPENKYAGGGTAEDMKSLLCFSAIFYANLTNHRPSAQTAPPLHPPTKHHISPAP